MDTEAEARAAIDGNVRLVVERLGPLSDVEFGLNRRSVAWVEGFIERQRVRPEFASADDNGLISVLGSFLGACIIAATEGDWNHSEHGWGVLLANGSLVFPFTKVAKQFDQGLAGGESITSFYDITIDYVATGKLGR